METKPKITGKIRFGDIFYESIRDKYWLVYGVSIKSYAIKSWDGEHLEIEFMEVTHRNNELLYPQMGIGLYQKGKDYDDLLKRLNKKGIIRVGRVKIGS